MTAEQLLAVACAAGILGLFLRRFLIRPRWLGKKLSYESGFIAVLIFALMITYLAGMSEGDESVAGQMIWWTHTAALLIFHVPLRGSFLLLLFGSVLFLMTNLGAGLFLSTISQTQQQAMMMNFFFSTPAFMLSGFAFPIRNMPVVVQWLTYANPLLYFLEIVRGIFLKGAGISVLWPQMVSLLVFGTVILTLSAARFHKKLD